MRNVRNYSSFELCFSKCNLYRYDGENALNIYRSKGVMCFKDQGNVKFIFQARLATTLHPTLSTLLLCVKTLFNR
jgi:hypothetical protein